MAHQVLIVDDTEVNLILFAALVKKLGDCTPHAFAQARDALAWLVDNEPDLIIVDYMMPDVDGLEFMRLLREVPGRAHVPVVMITANDQKQLRYRALDLGATDFLTKPVDKVEFLARTRNMLLVSEARKQLADRAAWLADEVRKATSEILARERETVFRLCKAAEYRDPETGQLFDRASLNSELEKIEKPAGISNPKDFRNEIVNFVLRARANNAGRNPNWTSYEKLRTVIEKKMFSNTEELLPVISFNSKTSAEEQKKHDNFVERMMEKGYTRKQVRLLSEWYLRVRKSS